MATFSNLLRTTGSKGQIGVPSREVTPIDIIVFDRVQNFLLSISESIALDANPNVLFTEIYDTLGNYAGRVSNLTYISESVENALEQARITNTYSTAYSGSIPSLHNANTVTLDGKIFKFPSQSFTRSFDDANGRGVLSNEGGSLVTFAYDSFSNLAHTPGMKLPVNIAESPTLSSRFNKFAESSSNYIPWFHSLKNLESLYSAEYPSRPEGYNWPRCYEQYKDQVGSLQEDMDLVFDKLDELKEMIKEIESDIKSLERRKRDK